MVSSTCFLSLVAVLINLSDLFPSSQDGTRWRGRLATVTETGLASKFYCTYTGTHNLPAQHEMRTSLLTVDKLLPCIHKWKRELSHSQLPFSHSQSRFHSSQPQMLPQFVVVPVPDFDRWSCLQDQLIQSVLLTQWKLRKKYKRFREIIGELSENRDRTERLQIKTFMKRNMVVVDRWNECKLNTFIISTPAVINYHTSRVTSREGWISSL